MRDRLLTSLKLYPCEDEPFLHDHVVSLHKRPGTIRQVDRLRIPYHVLQLVVELPQHDVFNDVDCGPQQFDHDRADEVMLNSDRRESEVFDTGVSDVVFD